LLTTSERDLEIFKKDLPQKKMCTIPNGTDLHYFAPQQTCPEPMTMVFTGLMNYYPNDHGALYFLEKVFPLILSSVPGARIFIVGAKPSRRLQRHASKNVIITGFVEDVRPFVARAQISVIPILIGGGTRLKALESMAMKKPIVSTTIGCEGINLMHEDSALFADTAEDFAKAVVRLFDDASLRARLAQKAYANVVEQYG
jgi:glycosyltransferase involved in cell wall biosynthesis